MTLFVRLVVAVPLLAAAMVQQHAAAQSSGTSAAPSAMTASPATPGPTPSTPASSGGKATGGSAASAETPLDRQEEEKMKKDTSICKGC